MFSSSTYAHIQQWARKNEMTQLVPFDVKYVRVLRDGKTKGKVLSYEHTYPHPSHSATFYMVLFEHVEDYVGIVPKKAWETYRSTSFGTDALKHNMPSMLAHFAVHVDHLKKACSSMVKAATIPGVHYTNPTNGMLCTDFVPAAVSQAPCFPQNSPSAEDETAEDDTCLPEESCGAVLALWEEIQNSGHDVADNAVAPLIFDFYLALSGFGLLRVEHKLTVASVRNFYLRNDRSSPFQKRRLWHVLYVQCSDGIFCVTRDQMDPEWATEPRPPAAFISKHTFSTFADAAKYIAEHAAEATAAADAAVGTVSGEDVDMNLLSRHKNLKLPVEVVGFSSPDADRENVGLPSLSDQINAACCAKRSAVCVPTGEGHPLGNHMLLSHTWSQTDVEDYQETGRTPLTLHSRKIYEDGLVCIVLRLQDHATSSSDLGDGGKFPLVMRSFLWSRPVEDRHFFIVGAIHDRKQLESGDPEASKYLLLPSELTRMYEGGDFLKPAAIEDRASAAHMRRIGDGRLSSWNDRERSAAFDGRFLQPTANIMRYIFPLRDSRPTLLQYLLNVLKGSNTISFDSPQSTTPNQAFDSSKYLMKPKDVIQAAWDYGCKCSLGFPFHVRSLTYMLVDLRRKAQRLREAQ
jgi:hypothetical protein